MRKEIRVSVERIVVWKDAPSRWLPATFYNQICDLGNNQAKFGSESSEDYIKSAQNLPKIWLVRPRVRPGQAAQPAAL